MYPQKHLPKALSPNLLKKSNWFIAEMPNFNILAFQICSQSQQGRTSRISYEPEISSFNDFNGELYPYTCVSLQKLNTVFTHKEKKMKEESYCHQQNAITREGTGEKAIMRHPEGWLAEPSMNKAWSCSPNSIVKLARDRKFKLKQNKWSESVPSHATKAVVEAKKNSLLITSQLDVEQKGFIK